MAEHEDEKTSGTAWTHDEVRQINNQSRHNERVGANLGMYISSVDCSDQIKVGAYKF